MKFIAMAISASLIPTAVNATLTLTAYSGLDHTQLTGPGSIINDQLSGWRPVNVHAADGSNTLNVAFDALSHPPVPPLTIVALSDALTPGAGTLTSFGALVGATATLILYGGDALASLHALAGPLTYHDTAWLVSLPIGGYAVEEIVVTVTADDVHHAAVQAGVDVRSVPEPVSLALFGLGLAGLGVVRRCA